MWGGKKGEFRDWTSFSVARFSTKIQFISRFYIRPSFSNFNIPFFSTLTFVFQLQHLFKRNCRFVQEGHSCIDVDDCLKIVICFLTSTFIVFKRGISNSTSVIEVKTERESWAPGFTGEQIGGRDIKMANSVNTTSVNT